jgi:hypothetical protein
MEFTLNDQKVREMTARLRTAFGPTQVTQSKALEVLAQTLGFANADTLKGLLKKEAAKAALSRKSTAAEVEAFVLKAPFMLYMEAFSCYEFGESPGWARIRVDQALMTTLLENQALCRERGLEHLATAPNLIEWGDQDNLNVRDEDLMVGKRSLWYRGRPKHAEYYVETRIIEIAELLKAIQDPSHCDGSIAWADGILFKSSDSAKTFALDLLDNEIIDISEACIDEMPGRR